MIDLLRNYLERTADQTSDTEKKESDSDTGEYCPSPPRDHEHMDHTFDPSRIHYGYFTRKKTWSKNVMNVYETYWHECRVCGNTCEHHDRDIGTFKITDDGLVIISGPANEG